MTQQIQDKFNELYPASESGTHNVRKSLYNVFKAGWEACLQAQEEPASGTRNGFYIPIVESEEGWGSKHDGYMVGFTIEDLEERRKVFEAANTEKYGYYYERPVRYIPIVLSPKAVETMSATEKERTRHCVWFDDIDDFRFGE